MRPPIGVTDQRSESTSFPVALRRESGHTKRFCRSGRWERNYVRRLIGEGDGSQSAGQPGGRLICQSNGLPSGAQLGGRLIGEGDGSQSAGQPGGRLIGVSDRERV
jgi:hypothetical protein